MKKSWKRVLAAALTVSLISSFNVPKITFAENIADDEIAISEENFPDKNFLNYIREAGFDTDKNGKLSEEELSSVKTIGVKWLKIKSLKGIEYFKNLKHINAEMNYIEELDLSQNKNLISVYCNNNMLKSIKLPNESENYTLEYLDIFSNMLTQVDLHNLKGLTFLHIDDNRIEVLDLSDNPLTAGHGFVAQNNYMKEITLPKNGKEYSWVEFLGTQLFPKDKENGYKVEWYLDKEKTQILDPKVTTEITLNGQILYAEYVPIEYTVKFNPGMGIGEVITQQFKYNTPQNLLKNQFTREGYEFAGWKDQNGKIYSDEAEILNLTDIDGKVISLTATWKKAMLNSEIKITTESLNKVYDGIEVQEPKVEKTGSTNKTVFTWYQLINDEWTKLSSAPIKTGKYKVVASVAADEDYKSASSEKEFEIIKAIPQYEKIENLKATYGDTLEDIKLPEGFSWQDDLSTSVGNAGENKFKVKYTPKDIENYEVVENIEVNITVEKAINTWIVDPSIEGWKTGENPNKPVGQAAFGEVEFTYSNLENGIFKKEIPTEAGIWYMKASVIGNENYSDLSTIKKFIISKNTNEWIEELNIKNWTYGEANIDPVAKSKYGNIEFTYSNSKDGIFTSTVPSNAGTWYVKASVKATEEYTGLESIKEFTISKAIPQYDKIENLKATYGDTLEDVKLPEGFSWQDDLSTSVGNAGENKFKVKYIPKDTSNYEVIENIEVTITVERATNTWTVDPSIEGWKYDEESKTPVGQSAFGEVEFLYSNSKDGIFTNTVPSNAGTWYVKASVKATENYTGLESIKEFEISKAIPQHDKIENLKATYGDTLEDVKLPEGFSWQDDLSTSVGNAGENKFKVKYTPKDTENYEVVENIEVIINVEKATNTWIVEPSIEGWKYGEESKIPVGQSVFGEVEFLYSNSKDGIFTNTVPSNAGTWYVKASVKATENYTGLENIKEFEISKAIPKYEKIDSLKAIYGDTLKDVKLPEGFTWQEDLSTLVGNAGENKFKVKYTPKDTENYEIVENIEVTVNVEKATNTWTVEPTIEGWKIGEKPNNPIGQAEFGVVEFTYSNLENGVFTKEIPTEAGIWYMKATVIGNENYSELSNIKKFIISKNTNEWIEELNIKNWTYGEDSIDPIAKSKYGNVEFAYSNSKDGIFTSIVPSNAGTWYVKANVKATEEYTGLESIKEFTISKATNTWIVEPAIEGWKYDEVSKNPVGQAKFGEVEFLYSNLKDGIFTNTVPTNAGTWYVKAIVKGTENYTGLEKVVSFVIEEVKNDNGDKEDQETGDEITKPDDEITKPGEEEKPSDDQKPSDEVITEVPTIKPNDKNDIIVNTKEDIKKVEVIIKDIESIKNGTGSLNIAINNSVQMNLPLSLIDKNLLEEAKNVSIKIDVLEDSDIIKDLKAINKVFDFNLIINNENETTSIHKFEDGLAEITFVLADEDFEGLNKDKLKVYYYNEETKKFETMETKVEGNNITFKTSHFSKYIISEEILDNNEEESNPEDNTTPDKDEDITNKPNTDNSKPTPDKDEEIITKPDDDSNIVKPDNNGGEINKPNTDTDAEKNPSKDPDKNEEVTIKPDTDDNKVDNGENVTESENGDLPETGAVVSSTIIVVLAIGIIAVGGAMFMKKRKKDIE